MKGNRLVLLLALPLIAACPGEANIPGGGGDGGADLGFYPLPDFGAYLDGGGGWLPIEAGSEGGSGVADGGAVQPDLLLSSSPGDPCPCALPLHCVGGTCRKQCTQQACNGAGGCGATEACVMTNQSIPVCVPGQGLGKACDSSAFCAGGLLCLTTDLSATSGTCYATCSTKGSTCATGGTCYDISGSTCLFCY